ncbi:bleomycin resistance protein [Vibrio methylphosphonaticus]|uniref:bleomycin resistance protein n=1 Tax=Vibrio methylphosphonaticus TaxID=2946866 RepID=UPI00202A3F5D|nr:VOC family protein [Vibrio methylphosphonaticus]MCL9774465.1 VOC family protein [Vibrio methylphosphonaticus]
MRVVPELYCFDIQRSIDFYVDVLGFRVKYQRPSEAFVFLTRHGVDLMLEGLNGDGRRWITGALEYPLGRGVNLQWDTDNIDAFYAHIKQHAPTSIYLPIERAGYLCDTETVTQKQFVVQDPNGYLIRFCESNTQLVAET